MENSVYHSQEIFRRNSEPFNSMNNLTYDNLKIPSHKISLDLSNLKNKIEESYQKTCYSPRKANGPKYKLLQEGNVQLYRLNHSRNIINKILTSNLLRRWEFHTIVLTNSEIYSTSNVGFMENSIPYASIEDIHAMSRWDSSQKFCVQINIPDACVLIQVNNSHLRDQWLYTLQWKKQVLKYSKILQSTTRPEVLTREIKNLIDLSMSIPLQDEEIHQIPLELISDLLQKNKCIPKAIHESIITALAPLLENNHPSPEICDFFTKHCKDSPRSTIIIEMFTSVVQRILKHNMCCNLQDFGRYPKMRIFVQEYIQALNSQNNGMEVVQDLVKNMHGQASICPHPGVLPNLVSVILSGIYSCYDEKLKYKHSSSDENYSGQDVERRLLCYLAMFQTMSSFEDWRPLLSSLLQPLPFPDDSFGHEPFMQNMEVVVKNIAEDGRCDVHQTLLGVREGKEGWLHLYCPGGIACSDEGHLFGVMLNTLIHCCCRRKKFLIFMNKMLGPCMLLALRDNEASMEVMCAMLEMDTVENHDLKLQIVTTLHSTNKGKRLYAELCDRLAALRELQQKGGPKKLTLPAKSTDKDLGKLLSCGSFGNLECLSLAFTHVTSLCAEHLIKLPSLKYLNLWSTQFGDLGLQLLSEHLPRLQVLNLCETPVTDKGLISLTAMKNLRKLNLNSTSLSAKTFEGLKEKLPALQECDIRYTDAW